MTALTPTTDLPKSQPTGPRIS